MKKNFVESVTILTLVVIAFSMFVGYSQRINNPAPADGSGDTAISLDPALAGKWVLERETGQQIDGLRFPAFDMELLKDGTGIQACHSSGIPGDVWGRGFTYKTEGSRFYFFLHHITVGAGAWNYKISGSTLTLTNDDSQSVTYKKRQ